jgi:aspartate oxidase
MNDVADLRSGSADQTTELDALVIGAGFAGLYQLLCLRDRLGLSVKASAIPAKSRSCAT